MPLLVDVRQLGVINELIRDAAENVAASFGTLAGVDATIDIRALSFVEPSDLPDEIGPREVYTATIDLTEPPYGSFMLTFSDATAEAVAELVVGEPVEGELSGMQRSALQEMCNICTSGFIDGFANTLNTTIDMGTPSLKHTDGDAIVENQLSHVHDETIAIVLDTTVHVPEEETDLELHVYLVPAPGAFVNLLDSIDLDADDVTASGQISG